MSNKEEIEKAKEWLNYMKKEELFLPYTSNILQYIEQLEQENNKLNKINNEMAEYLAIVRDCPNEDKGANLDCENRCSDNDSIYAECWKLYFERKVKEK